MNRTIHAIERHMISPVRCQWGSHLGPPSKVPPVRSETRRGELGLQAHAAKLVAEWQQRGPETLSGHALRKLRLALAPQQSVLTASSVA